MSEIPIPPTSRHLGRCVTVTWHSGATATGALTEVRETGITIEKDRALTPIPYEAIASLHLTEDDPAPVSPPTERLNEIRDQLMKAAETLPDVKGTHVSGAAAGTFGITFTDRTGAVVDIWHS